MNFDEIATFSHKSIARIICIKRHPDSPIIPHENPADNFAAVKCYRKVDVLKRNMSEKVQLEETILRKLNNPYICKFVGPPLSEDDNYKYIIMEAVLAGPLHLHIRQFAGRCFDAHTCATYASEIISALFHMRRAGCVHRDIKANNVVLQCDGHIRLCDFSCSKLLEESLPSPSTSSGSSRKKASMTPKTYTVVGTPHNMAPEMIAKIGYSYEVDWWSFGILLYEMMTGDPPSNTGLRLLPVTYNPIEHGAFTFAAKVTSIHSTEEDQKREALIKIEQDIQGIGSSDYQEEPDTEKVAAAVDEKGEEEEEDEGQRKKEVTIEEETLALEQKTNKKDRKKRKKAERKWWEIDYDRDYFHERNGELAVLMLSLIQQLLRVAPSHRWGADMTREITGHPVFAHINWETVFAGTSPPVDPYNKELGYLDLLQSGNYEDDEDILSPEQQSLFEGF